MFWVCCSKIEFFFKYCNIYCPPFLVFSKITVKDFKLNYLASRLTFALQFFL
jgi:hypothetical protein